MMAPGYARGILPAVVFALVSALAFGPWGQASALAQGPTAADDKELVRQKELEQLLSQAHQDLMNGNPQAAKEKCEQILQEDPNNAGASVLLSQAERLLKGATSTEMRSPVSSLPDGVNLTEAVKRARPTTPTIVMPSDRARSPATEGAGLLRPAAVEGAAGEAVPSAAPAWLSRRHLLWAAAALLAIVLFLLVLMVLDRLSSGKRQQAAQDKFFEQMRTASERSLENIAADTAPSTGPFGGFPIDISTPIDPLEMTMPTAKAATPGDDAEVDYWEREKGGKKPPRPIGAVTAALTAADATAPAGEDDESEVIPAEKAFVDEGFGFGPAPSGEAQPSPAAETVPATEKPRFTPPPAPPQDDEGPILMENIAVQSPGIEDFVEPLETAGEAFDLRPPTVIENEPIEPASREAADAETSFPLDVSLDQTDTTPESPPGKTE